MAVYLYKPPTYKQHFILHGSMRSYVDTSTTVYRLGGQWFNVLSPGIDSPHVADCDVIRPNTPTQLRLYFNKPMVVPDDIYAELSALQPADPSWSPGTLTLL